MTAARCWGCGRPSPHGLYCTVCVPNALPGLCSTCGTPQAEGWLDGEPCCIACVELALERSAVEAADPFGRTTNLLPSLADGTATLVQVVVDSRTDG